MNSNELTEIREESKKFPALPEKIATPDIYEDIGNWRVEAQKEIKIRKEYFKDKKKDAEIAYKNVVKMEKDAIKPLQTFVEDADKVLGAYTLEQERLRKIEEERLRKIAEKKADDEKLEAAEQASTPDEAEAILNEETFTPPPVVQSATPKVSGLAMRTTWKWKTINEKLIPREFLKIDEKKINSRVTSLKSATKIQGIMVYEDKKIGGARS